MNSLTRLLFGIVTLFAGTAATAAPLDVKTGLWETTSTTHVSGMAIPPEALANMPPEQRAKVAAMMDAQNDKTQTSKSCVTKADLDRPFQAQSGAEHCTRTVVRSSATEAEYKIQCRGKQVREGIMHVQALSREQIKESFTMDTGHATVSHEGTSRWISADCGAVKPQQ